ncbi:predicted protein, partial [Naegleria gruberi]
AVSSSTENKKTEEKSNPPTFVLPTTNTSKREERPSQKPATIETPVIAPDTNKQTPQLDLSAFKQPEPKPIDNAQPTVKLGTETKSTGPTATLNIPSVGSHQDNVNKENESDSNPFASIIIPSSSSSSTDNPPATETTNPFANLKVATPTEQKKNVFNPFANTTSSSMFGTPSSRNTFNKTTPSKPADSVSDFAKMDPSIFQREALSFGYQK